MTENVSDSHTSEKMAKAKTPSPNIATRKKCMPIIIGTKTRLSMTCVNTSPP